MGVSFNTASKRNYAMPKQANDYLENKYKDNLLRQIKYYEGSDSLLEQDNFYPFYEYDNIQPSDYINYSGFAPRGAEEVYINNLDMVGEQVTPAAPLSASIDPKDPQSLARKKMLDKIAAEEALKQTAREQQMADFYSDRMARTGLHEAIHSTMLDRRKGAYPNAINQMLKGTSELGVGGSTTNFLGERIYGPPNINNQYVESMFDPYYEQNELITQDLTERLMSQPDYPFMSEGMMKPPAVRPTYSYSTWNMDKPGGPMTEDGIRGFVHKVTQPFYEQLERDAEKGYIQDSVYATPSHLWGIRTQGT